jgi:hypothetical protein
VSPRWILTRGRETTVFPAAPECATCCAMGLACLPRCPNLLRRGGPVEPDRRGRHSRARRGRRHMDGRRRSARPLPRRPWSVDAVRFLLPSVRCAHQHHVVLRVCLVGWNRGCGLWAVGAPPTETHHAHASKVQTTSEPFLGLVLQKNHTNRGACQGASYCAAMPAYASTELGDAPKCALWCHRNPLRRAAESEATVVTVAWHGSSGTDSRPPHLLSTGEPKQRKLLPSSQFLWLTRIPNSSF